VPPPAAASPEISDRPKQRQFSAQEKLRILRKANGVTGKGMISGILLREGLYSSALTAWRRQRDAGAFDALLPAKRGPKRCPISPLTAELAVAQREIIRLGHRLEQADAIIDDPKKIFALLGMTLSPPSGNTMP
jgi:transposase